MSFGSGSGDTTNTAGTNYNSGNPGYTDSSMGASTPDVPNAKPHAMVDKKDQAKKKPRAEGKVFDPQEAGYVDDVTPKQCQTCEYFSKPNVCNLPLSIPVDPKNGCCNFWQNANKGKSEAITVSNRFCRSCSKSADEKTVTCPDCGSMEWTDKPMSKYTLAGSG